MVDATVIEIYLYPEKGGPASVVEVVTAVATVFRGGAIRVGDPITVWGQD